MASAATVSACVPGSPTGKSADAVRQSASRSTPTARRVRAVACAVYVRVMVNHPDHATLRIA